MDDGEDDVMLDLPPLSYGFIMADPPWRYANWSRAGEHKGAAAQYSCMSLDEIKALPVGQLATPDAILMLWATNPLLDTAFSVLEAWGFTFKTAGHWVKKTKNGKLGFGTGYLLRGACEPFLLGTIGSPKTSKSCRSVIEGLTREHSRKPDEAYEWAEKLLPNVRRADLFSRENRLGWDSWGNETGKFAEAAE
jgi:N6-adenosine-specific RNA methylase IME4